MIAARLTGVWRFPGFPLYWGVAQTTDSMSRPALSPGILTVGEGLIGWITPLRSVTLRSPSALAMMLRPLLLISKASSVIITRERPTLLTASWLSGMPHPIALMNGTSRFWTSIVLTRALATA